MKSTTLFVLAATIAAAQESNFTNVMSRKIEFEGKVVAGAPYSAQAVTETTQVLADGNRITRKSASFIARDGMGRMRREQNFNSVGPWPVQGNEGSLVTISDPVAGVRYILEPNSKAAIKTAVNMNSERTRNREMEDKLKAERAMEKAINRETSGNAEALRNTAKTEPLGSQLIGGVTAEGKRITETIPAGKLGNEKPIDVINETWYSAELQTVVMSKHSDPRTGDVVYTLNNIQRVEPDPSLFAPPADYKLRDETAGRSEVRRPVPAER